MSKKKYEIPPPPSEDMTRISDLTPEEIIRVIDALPDEVDVGGAVELIINVIGNYGMQGAIPEIVLNLLMFAEQKGMVSTQVKIEDTEVLQ